jgi:RNA polymerase sigma factor (sigma-70 family)
MSESVREQRPGAVHDLVLAARAGDSEAWEALIRRYDGLVRRVGRGFAVSATDLDDVSQTVWLRAYRSLGDLIEPSAIPGWLITTTRRVALAMVQGRQPWVALESVGLADESSVDSFHAVEERVIRERSRERLQVVIGELEPRHQQLLALLAADPPVSYKEISRKLGVPVGSIGPTRQRCIEKLHRAMTVDEAAA